MLFFFFSFFDRQAPVLVAAEKSEAVFKLIISMYVSSKRSASLVLKLQYLSNFEEVDDSNFKISKSRLRPSSQNIYLIDNHHQN